MAPVVDPPATSPRGPHHLAPRVIAKFPCSSVDNISGPGTMTVGLVRLYSATGDQLCERRSSRFGRVAHGAASEATSCRAKLNSGPDCNPEL